MGEAVWLTMNMALVASLLVAAYALVPSCSVSGIVRLWTFGVVLFLILAALALRRGLIRVWLRSKRRCAQDAQS